MNEPIGILEDYLDGDLNAESMASLLRWLEESDAHVDQFVRISHQHYQLYDQLNQQHIADLNLPPDLEVRPQEQLKRRVPRFAWTGLALAATLLMAAVAVVIYGVSLNSSNAKPDAPPRPHFATLTWADRAVDGDGPLMTGESFGTRTIRTRGGESEIQLTSGGSVEIYGASELTLHTAMSATLLKGTARFNCPPSANGYAVHLPGGARVVDLGTRFTVTVDAAGDAAVRVLEGRVRLVDRTGHAPVELAAGQRGTADHFGRVSEGDRFPGTIVAGIYDWSTAVAGPVGVPLDRAALEADNNDNWQRLGGNGDGSDDGVRNARSPSPHLGKHFLLGSGGDDLYLRPNDDRFAYAIPASARRVQVSFVVHTLGGEQSTAHIGFSSSGRWLQFGLGGGRWMIRNFDSSFLASVPAPAGSGPAAIDTNPRSYRVTLDVLVDSESPAASMCSLRVENLTDGEEQIVADGVPIDLTHHADPSRWTGLYARVNRAAVGPITIACIIKPDDEQLHKTGHDPEDRHREATDRGSTAEDSPHRKEDRTTHPKEPE